MVRRPPSSTRVRSSAASDVYKRQSGHRRQGDPSRPEHAQPDHQQVHLQGWRPDHIPWPAQGRPRRNRRRGERPLRRPPARRGKPLRHVPVHRHPGRRHDDDPRGHRRQDQPGADLLLDEPRSDRERGYQPGRPGLPRSLHQGTPDGVRHRIQPARQTRDGGFAGMTAAEGAPAAHVTGAAATPTSVASRQAPTDLTLSFVDDATVRAVSAAAGDPDWLLAERLEGLRAFEALPIETNPLYTTYVDLRNAKLAGTLSLLGHAGTAAEIARDAKLLPEGAAGYAEISDDRVTALVLEPEARDAGSSTSAVT